VTDLNDLAERYIQLWNEPDADVRRKVIVELFAEDGTHVDDAVDVKGHDAIEQIVTVAHQQFVAEGGFRFRSRGNADGFRNVVRFNWEMHPAGSDQVLAVGFDFITLNDDGRIRADYQFMEMAA
jgi:SnoaL-like protein